VATIEPRMTQEVQVQTSNFGADVQKGPVVINTIGKSGTRNYHGSLWFDARNDVLNANDWFDNHNQVARGKAHYYYPGGEFGGPVPFTKKKVFFWFGYDHFLQNTGNASSLTSYIPALGMLQGNFTSGGDGVSALCPNLDANGNDSSGGSKNNTACAGVNGMVLPDGATAPNVDRIPLYEVYMRMAEELAKRSTCARLQVGTVVTDQVLENVLAIGYNGNARGLPNKCDSAVPGSCGCILSEMNALVKAPGSVRDKVVFVSASPCVMCAKLIINSGVTHVFYRKAYRDPSGVEVLQQGGVVPVLYDRWMNAWRNGS